MRRWFFRLLSAVVGVLVILCAAAWLLGVYPRRNPHPPLRLAQGTLAIQHARVYISPTQPPIDDATIVVRDGLIAAVGQGIQIPSGATLLPCDHCVVTAGFWNAHVHFSQPRWTLTEWKPAAQLHAGLADMFLSRGFTTVVDLGSNPADTIALRRRVELGELDRPFIYTAGASLYPPHGIPYYLRETLPKWMLLLMPQPDTPEKAQRLVRHNLNSGADVTKLFTGSWVERGRVLPMPLDIAKAAVAETHQNGHLVFAHPSNLAGTRVAIESGVDVLAMLTTNPAARMGASSQKGTVTVGKLADLTILDADPVTDLSNFSRVRTTIRSGKVVYQRP